jgi:hypothetical protein
MPANNRVAVRNLHLFNATTGAALGGACQNGSLTENLLLWSLANVILVVDDPFTVTHKYSGHPVTPTSNPVAPGEYLVHSTGMPSHHRAAVDFPI